MCMCVCVCVCVCVYWEYIKVFSSNTKMVKYSRAIENVL